MFILRNNGNLWITKQNGTAWAPTCHKVQSSDVPPLFAEPELWTQWWETLKGWVCGAGHWATAARPWEDRKESSSLVSRIAWVMAAFSHVCDLLPDTLYNHEQHIWSEGMVSDLLSEDFVAVRLAINQHIVSGNQIPRGHANKLKPLVGKNFAKSEHSTPVHGTGGHLWTQLSNSPEDPIRHIKSVRTVEASEGEARHSQKITVFLESSPNNQPRTTA